MPRIDGERVLEVDLGLADVVDDGGEVVVRERVERPQSAMR